MAVESYAIREAVLTDNPAIAEVIRTVMPEFDCDGPGYAIHDPEVDQMVESYAHPRARLYVVTSPEGAVVGCGALAPLEGGDEATCEIKKMYFLKAVRGQGMGRALLNHLLDEARILGFTRAYIETVARMEQANRLYQKLGFEKAEERLGNTGHFGCDTLYVRTL